MHPGRQHQRQRQTEKERQGQHHGRLATRRAEPPAHGRDGCDDREGEEEPGPEATPFVPVVDRRRSRIAVEQEPGEIGRVLPHQPRGGVPAVFDRVARAQILARPRPGRRSSPRAAHPARGNSSSPRPAGPVLARSTPPAPSSPPARPARRGARPAAERRAALGCESPRGRAARSPAARAGAPARRRRCQARVTRRAALLAASANRRLCRRPAHAPAPARRAAAAAAMRRPGLPCARRAGRPATSPAAARPAWLAPVRRSFSPGATTAERIRAARSATGTRIASSPTPARAMPIATGKPTSGPCPLSVISPSVGAQISNVGPVGGSQYVAQRQAV